MVEDKVKLSRLHKKVLDKLSKHSEPVTASELFYKHFAHENLVFSNMRARIAELRDMGAVKEAGRRACNITGVNVLTWILTGDEPQKVNKISRKHRKNLIIEQLSIMFKQAKDPLQKEGFKLLFRMIKEL
jgi:hypothetical protein